MQSNKQSLDSVWVTKIVKRGVENFKISSFLSSFITLGCISLATTVIVFILGSPSRSFVIGQSLTASISILGPYQAYVYDTSVLPSFISDVKTLIEDENHNKLHELQEEYEQKFRGNHHWFSLLWTMAVVSVLPLNAEYFANQGIQYFGPAYLAYIIFLIHIGLLSGLGIYSVFVTNQYIGDIADLGFEIEPLHPDGLGGLTVIGNFAVWTTLLISNGAFGIPLALDMITTQAGKAVNYSGVAVYVIVIAFSFVYPTVRINRKAQSLREEHLEEYKSKIRMLESELVDIETEEQIRRKEIALRMEIERTRKEFQNYRDVRLYPLSIGILTRLASSVLLPIVITVVEFYASSILT